MLSRLDEVEHINAPSSRGDEKNQVASGDEGHWGHLHFSGQLKQLAHVCEALCELLDVAEVTIICVTISRVTIIRGRIRGTCRCTCRTPGVSKLSNGKHAVIKR